MALDDVNTLFSSNWELDQLLLSGQMTLNPPIGDVFHIPYEIVDYSDLELDYFPMAMIVTRHVGETKWHMQGDEAPYDGTGHDPVFPVISKTKLFCFTAPGSSWEIRYYIFKNKGTV